MRCTVMLSIKCVSIWIYDHLQLPVACKSRAAAAFYLYSTGVKRQTCGFLDYFQITASRDPGQTLLLRAAELSACSA